ncbi:carbonic anhydrase [Bacillus sp. B15-48]|uniref:beta-class carbonic anhydrase n=1 Tax=Bacillus sp. B15-48 TaxID=1548601 RepID=UPI00194001C8|nr:carbonic anhydrase [Bacillus sp. B15-48]MBM4762657.1 carbonic anhydrase [Bacillus sp. B15-48]
MSLLYDILEYNEKFVTEKKYQQFETTKFPNKKMVILTCMDTRLLELLPNALNVRNGDVKIVKNAGALVTHPFGSIMRSILVAVYQLKAQEVLVIGHHDCGMSGMKPDLMLTELRKRGIKEETFDTLQYSGIDVESWLQGFDNVNDSVAHSVEVIKNHPFMAKEIPVHGLVIDPATGKLDVVINGYDV